MARDNVMSTPIFDQLLHEMAQRPEPPAPAAAPAPESPAVAPAPPAEVKAKEGVKRSPASRRRHRAD